MEKTLLGLHHITCIASDPQGHLDFYTQVLGLRLVKLTVNQDDPGTYHTYFGDESGSPGTLMTFFPWPGARRGHVGAGQAGATAFSIPVGSSGFWLARLHDLGVNGIEQLPPRFGETVIRLNGPDGLPLELVEALNDPRPGRAADGVPVEHSIRGFHSVTLLESAYAPTAKLLAETMGFRLEGEEGDRFRFVAGDGTAGTIVDLLIVGAGEQRGLQGAGTVHHVAFRTPTVEDHAAWHQTIADLGYTISPIIERTYFKSIYYREPGGVLFEIATDPPGMTIDEPLDQLGHRLVLTPQYAPYCTEIERVLPKLRLPSDKE